MFDLENTLYAKCLLQEENGPNGLETRKASYPDTVYRKGDIAALQAAKDFEIHATRDCG